MADNYLEKQRAEYEERKAQWEKDKKMGKHIKKKKATPSVQTKVEK